MFQSLDSELRTVPSIGLLETHGAPTMVNLDSLESSEVLTTLLLKPIAHGLLQLIPGQTEPLTRPLKLRRTILETRNTLRMVLIPIVKKILKPSWNPNTVAREFHKLLSKTVWLNLSQCHGNILMLPLYPPTGTGETWTTLTSFPGQRTNISPSIVDHAGLKEPPHLLLIDSTFFWKIITQLPSILTPKLSSTVKLVVHAMVEIHQVFTNMLSRLVFLIPHASNTLPKTWTRPPVVPLISVKIAEVPLPLKVMTDKLTAGLLTTRSTMFQTTTVFQVPTRWRLRSSNTDPSPAVLWLPINSKSTPVVSTPRKPCGPWSITKSPSSDGDSKNQPTLNIGLVETHGELTGENKDSSELKCTLTTSPLRLIALLVSHHSPKPQEKLKNLSSDNIDLSQSNLIDNKFNIINKMSLISIAIYVSGIPVILESSEPFKFK